MWKWLIIQPNPAIVGQTADTEARFLSRHAENFAAWYRHIIQENPSVAYKAKELLQDVLPGFEELSLREAGESRLLKAGFRIEGKVYSFGFKDLSDGQQQLIMLYTILEAMRQKSVFSLLIDEPDNYVSLREVLPWVKELQDLCDDSLGQAIIISHHPSNVDHMTHGNEQWFSRKNGLHTILSRYPVTDGLTPAETMERGWDDE